MAVESNFVFPMNNTKIVMNFGKICRFCLSEAYNNITIRDKCLPIGSSETEGDTIYNFVTKLKIIKMNSPENFPSLVCKNCYEIIKICSNFIRVCQKSENLLHSFYEKAKKETREDLKGLNSVTADCSYKNAEIIDVGTNHHIDKELEENSKIQEIKIEKRIFLISEVAKESLENSKSSDFTGSVSLDLENENYCCSLCSVKFTNQEALKLHYFCVHEKRFKKLFVKQENLITHCNTHNIQVSKQSNEDFKDMKNFVQDDAKPLFCFYCIPCKEFQIKKDLLEHMKCHNTEECFNCPYCEESFFSKLSCKEHLIGIHNLKADIVSHENVKFLRQDYTTVDKENDVLIDSVTDFLNVYQDKSSNFKVCCKHCNPFMDFATTNDFIKHISVHHSNGKITENKAFEGKTPVENNSKLKYSDCPATYSQKQYLLSHLQEKHNKLCTQYMKCPVCSETFLTNRKFIKHGITAHQKYFANFHNVFNKIIKPSNEEVIQNKNFECDMCQKRYIFKTSLKKHIFSVHLGELKGSVTCPHCGKTLANKFNLQSHIEFKHEALFVSCPICKKKINFKTIGRHYKVHQNVSEGQANSFLCTQCGKILKSKRSFEDHQKLHKNDRNELCDVCGGGYATKKALRLHKKTHEGSQRKLYKCEQCDKVFSGKHTLNRHLLTHSGVKNFICEICSKCFYTLQELKRHVRYHKKEYRFECQQCDMRFVDKSRFRHHLMKHKNIRPHKCQFCEKMFIVRGKMNLHMASKHNFQVDSRRVWKDPKAYVPLDKLL